MIAVTGGTGLVGAYLLLKLAEQDKPVRVLLRPGSKAEKVFAVWKHYLDDPQEMLSRFEWVTVDHGNRPDLFEGLKDAEYIYHCAGKVSFDKRDKKAMWETNVYLTRDIVDYCLENDVKKLGYVSSVAAVNTPPGEIASENSGWPTNKRNLYSLTKTRGEFEVWRGIAEGLKAVIVNPSVIIGPGNWQQSSARIFDNIYKGLKFYAPGSTGFVDNRDVADALIQLMNSDISGERFILNAAQLSYREMFEKVAVAMNKPVPSRQLSPLLSEIAWRGEWLISRLTGKEARLTRQTARTAFAHKAYSGEKVCEALGFEYRGLEDAIKETCNCYTKGTK